MNTGEEMPDASLPAASEASTPWSLRSKDQDEVMEDVNQASPKRAAKRRHDDSATTVTNRSKKRKAAPKPEIPDVEMDDASTASTVESARPPSHQNRSANTVVGQTKSDPVANPRRYSTRRNHANLSPVATTYSSNKASAALGLQTPQLTRAVDPDSMQMYKNLRSGPKLINFDPRKSQLHASSTIHQKLASAPMKKSNTTKGAEPLQPVTNVTHDEKEFEAKRIFVGSIKRIVFWIMFIMLLISIVMMTLIVDKFVEFPNVVEHFSTDHMGPNSVYIPGAGFSGFWYTLGRLHRLDKLKERDFYCFSAGCLAVVSTLQKRSFKDVSKMATKVQSEWEQGKVDTYRVTEHFVDDLLGFKVHIEDEIVEESDSDVVANATKKKGLRRLLPPIGKKRQSKGKKAKFDVSSVHVITTVKSSIGLHYELQTPQTLEELRAMLIQTTHIPFATGSNKFMDDRHLDGGFSVLLHPACDLHLELPIHFDMLINFLNIKMPEAKAEEFWKAGVERGI